MDVEGSVSLYTKDAIVNGNGRDVVKGADNIRANFVGYYNSSESINHSAKVIAAYEFGDKAFAYGKWIEYLRMALEPQERGTGLLIT